MKGVKRVSNLQEFIRGKSRKNLYGIALPSLFAFSKPVIIAYAVVGGVAVLSVSLAVLEKHLLRRGKIAEAEIVGSIGDMIFPCLAGAGIIYFISWFPLL